MALIMALFLCLIVVSMVTVLLAWIQYDNQFATRTTMASRAYYLARSGLEWFRLNGGQMTASPSSTVVPVTSAAAESFTVSLDAQGNLTSVGQVNSGRTSYTRALWVPFLATPPGGATPGLQFSDVRDEGGQ
jgi:type II secretory pathway component PulK